MWLQIKEKKWLFIALIFILLLGFIGFSIVRSNLQAGSTISIQDCGSRDYFQKKMDEWKIRYKIRENGDYEIPQEEREKFNMMTKNDFFSFIPASAASGEGEKCRMRKQ